MSFRHGVSSSATEEFKCVKLRDADNENVKVFRGLCLRRGDQRASFPRFGLILKSKHPRINYAARTQSHAGAQNPRFQVPARGVSLNRYIVSQCSDLQTSPSGSEGGEQDLPLKLRCEASVTNNEGYLPSDICA